MPPHQLVGMPSLSPTMEAGQIAKWNKETGDTFQAGDVFCEIQTDKATVDFEAQDDGIIAKILAPAGSADVKCGDPIVVIVQEPDDVAAFQNYAVSSSSSNIPVAEPTSATGVAAPPPAVTAPPPVASTTTTTTTTSAGKLIASPLAFKLAKELGKDISAIQGTGPGGRVLADDVKEYIPMVSTPNTATTTKILPERPIVGSGFVDYPLAPSAMESAARLTQAKRNIPHYYLTIDLKLDAMLQLRSSLTNTKSSSAASTTISLNDLLLKAAACAMKAVPEANASWMDTFVRVYDNVDINVVVNGGYTPLIRNVHQKGLVQIGTEFTTLLEKANEHTLEREDYAVGTFTVVNLGSYGIKSAASIIFEPQACLLTFGAAENRIVPNTNSEDSIYQQAVMMTATLSCDHRVIDGAVGAQWLSAFKSHVENPNTLLF
jgi:pyruvate dehydrogenase E2 component (dihydrolipoamide acetyltransferase)